MSARYYDGSTGKFISIDPEARDNPSRFINDPQQLNSYSYSRNNPLVYVDKTGKFPLLAIVLANPVIASYIALDASLFASNSKLCCKRRSETAT